MLTPTFHFSILENFMDIFNNHVRPFVRSMKSCATIQARILAHTLEPMADSGQKFDISQYLKRCALDIVCGKSCFCFLLSAFDSLIDAAMRVPINAQTEPKLPYVRAVEELAEIAVK